MEFEEGLLLMSAQVVLALGVAVATMVIALVGILLRRKAAVTGKQPPTMPRAVTVGLLGVGVLLLLVVIVGLVLVSLL